MSDKGQDVDLTRAKQNTGVWLVKVGDLSVRSCFLGFTGAEQTLEY